MKKWMKMTATMMAAAMALTACGGNDAADDSADAGETYTVGIIQQLEHPALDQATKGFEDKTAGVVDSNEKPGRNVTGVSDLAPVDQQIQLLMKLVPDTKKVGIVYCSAEPNSAYQAKLAEAELDKEGIAWAEFTAADSNEVQSVVTKAVGECDALYISTDNTIANNTEIVKNVAVPAGIPVVTGEEGMCSGCGLATLSISYYDLGVKAAEMAYEILTNGADPAQMAIGYVTDGITEKYNADIAEALNITIPEDMVAIEN